MKFRHVSVGFIVWPIADITRKHELVEYHIVENFYCTNEVSLQTHVPSLMDVL